MSQKSISKWQSGKQESNGHREGKAWGAQSGTNSFEQKMVRQGQAATLKLPFLENSFFFNLTQNYIFTLFAC